MLYSCRSTRTCLMQAQPKRPEVNQFIGSRMVNKHANAFLLRERKPFGFPDQRASSHSRPHFDSWTSTYIPMLQETHLETGDRAGSLVPSEALPSTSLSSVKAALIGGGIGHGAARSVRDSPSSATARSHHGKAPKGRQAENPPSAACLRDHLASNTVGRGPRNPKELATGGNSRCFLRLDLGPTSGTATLFIPAGSRVVRAVPGRRIGRWPHLNP